VGSLFKNCSRYVYRRISGASVIGRGSNRQRQTRKSTAASPGRWKDQQAGGREIGRSSLETMHTYVDAQQFLVTSGGSGGGWIESVAHCTPGKEEGESRAMYQAVCVSVFLFSFCFYERSRGGDEASSAGGGDIVPWPQSGRMQ
jgi:hypothetical protein